MTADTSNATASSQPQADLESPGNQAAVEILRWLLARRRRRLARQMATERDAAISAAHMSRAEPGNLGDAVGDSVANGTAT